MIAWRVEYGTTDGAPIVTRAGEGEGEWRKLPTLPDLRPARGVVRAHLHHGPYRRTLQGKDAYWLTEGVFGMLNDPENRRWYEGVMANAWAWPTPDQCVPLTDARPPAGAHVIRGVMLPDWQARALGIL